MIDNIKCNTEKDCTKLAHFVIYINGRPAYACKKHSKQGTIHRKLPNPGQDVGRS